jgi:hypothetical protein
MKPQVRWASREWALLANYFIDNNINPDAYGFSGALDAAQKNKLPPERWRSVKGVPATLKKEIKEQIKLLEHKMREELQQPVQYTPPPGPEALSTEDLLVELARRIARLLEPAKPNPVDRAFFPPPASQETKFEKKEKLRILVCGPNGDTSQSLRTQFPSLDLRFRRYEENPAHVATRAQGVDYILCITKFMAHSAVEAVKATTIPYKLVTSVREAREVG